MLLRSQSLMRQAGRSRSRLRGKRLRVLAGTAKEGAAPGLEDALNGCATFRAGPAFAIINTQSFLVKIRSVRSAAKVKEVIFRVASLIIQRNGAAKTDCLKKNLPNSGPQPFDLFGAQATRRRERRNAGPE